MRLVFGFLCALITLPAFALPLEHTVRPLMRGEAVAEGALVRPRARPVQEIEKAVQNTNLMRPALRPLSAQQEYDRSVAQVDAPILLAAASALPASLRPHRRPKGLVQEVMAKRRARKRGAICGDLDIQGEGAGSIPGRIRGCGIPKAVRVKAVSGVRLSTGALMDCTTAKALKRWVDQGAKPAIGNRGGGIASLRVAAHYACRTRNNRPGARLSEHAKGKAIDISGMTLRDGTVITVLKGWRSSRDGKALKRMHKAACGPFGTVLGPKADRYHQDHFHFDTAKHRGGAYCR